MRERSPASNETADGYGREDGAVAGYARVVATYVTAVGGVALALRLKGRRLPALTVNDLLLFGVATHHLAHLVAKEPIGSPLRAPFTRFEGPSGPAELKESVRGEGLKKSVGELLTCPFCLGQWIATGFAVGVAAAPRATRLAAGVCAVAAFSDGLQLARSRLQS
jgi:hypothetical protein